MYKVGTILCSSRQLFAILLIRIELGYSVQNVSRTRIPTFKVEPWTGHVSHRLDNSVRPLYVRQLRASMDRHARAASSMTSYFSRS